MKIATGVMSGVLVALTATAALAQTPYDDQVCRQWASQNANYAQAQANNNAAGSALGGVARYACSSLLARTFGEGFPLGTLLVNVLGSFIIGFFATATGPDGRVLVSPNARLFVTVGLCGGYTTFSSFSLQTLTLAQDGEFIRAGLNVVGSVALCLVSVWLGFIAAQALTAVRGS